MAEAFGLGDLRESRFSEAVSGADSGVDVSLGVGGGLRNMDSHRFLLSIQSPLL